MKPSGSASKLHRDRSGSAFLEFTVVFPLLVLTVLGVVDASLLMLDWSAGNKATYRGARVAIVNDPVADSALFSLSDYTTLATQSGNYCVKDDGTRSTTANCPQVNITCTGATTKGSCTAGTFNDTSFTKIFKAVQEMYPGRKLDRAQLQVSYVTSNLGFVGQQDMTGTKGQLPMNVTVSLRCMGHKFFFISGLMRWVTPTRSDCKDITGVSTSGLIMPNFYTTLPSESLYSF